MVSSDFTLDLQLHRPLESDSSPSPRENVKVTLLWQPFKNVIPAAKITMWGEGKDANAILVMIVT